MLYVHVRFTYIVFNITMLKKVADMTQIGLQADEKSPWREKKTYPITADGLSSSSKAFCPHPGLSLIQHESGTRDKLGTKGLLLPVSEKKIRKNQ